MAHKREEDLIELYRMLDTERHPETRRNIRDTIQTIKNESSLIGSMREALMQAHRNKNLSEIKDIHDYIKGKERYGQRGDN